MPNGNPGDHPFSDVAVHGMKVYGRVIDGLIRRVAKTGGMDEQAWCVLLSNDPRIDGDACDFAAVEATLRRLLAARRGRGRSD